MYTRLVNGRYVLVSPAGQAAPDAGPPPAPALVPPDPGLQLRSFVVAALAFSGLFWFAWVSNPKRIKEFEAKYPRR